jgi:hypothetical protein
VCFCAHQSISLIFHLWVVYSLYKITKCSVPSIVEGKKDYAADDSENMGHRPQTTKIDQRPSQS